MLINSMASGANRAEFRAAMLPDSDFPRVFATSSSPVSAIEYQAGNHGLNARLPAIGL